ncbi:WAS/WASL-interacting protein family member 1-like [Vombatus ursinus]|uniref:WAS/WASL-interacting protein family member 1-like n=1 Tax=Vombatus ursinus TaxID=29139 RepID=UPI000FFD23C0|nr:WAS/WASL-interacting protein family member 1-like [Vombatus ursinus]
MPQNRSGETLEKNEKLKPSSQGPTRLRKQGDRVAGQPRSQSKSPRRPGKAGTHPERIPCASPGRRPPAPSPQPLLHRMQLNFTLLQTRCLKPNLHGQLALITPKISFKNCKQPLLCTTVARSNQFPPPSGVRAPASLRPVWGWVLGSNLPLKMSRKGNCFFKGEPRGVGGLFARKRSGSVSSGTVIETPPFTRISGGGGGGPGMREGRVYLTHKMPTAIEPRRTRGHFPSRRHNFSLFLRGGLARPLLWGLHVPAPPWPLPASIPAPRRTHHGRPSLEGPRPPSAPLGCSALLQPWGASAGSQASLSGPPRASQCSFPPHFRTPPPALPAPHYSLPTPLRMPEPPFRAPRSPSRLPPHTHTPPFTASKGPSFPGAGGAHYPTLIPLPWPNPYPRIPNLSNSRLHSAASPLPRAWPHLAPAPPGPSPASSRPEKGPNGGDDTTRLPGIFCDPYSPLSRQRPLPPPPSCGGPPGPAPAGASQLPSSAPSLRSGLRGAARRWRRRRILRSLQLSAEPQHRADRPPPPSPPSLPLPAPPPVLTLARNYFTLLARGISAGQAPLPDPRHITYYPPYPSTTQPPFPVPPPRPLSDLPIPTRDQEGVCVGFYWYPSAGVTPSTPTPVSFLVAGTNSPLGPWGPQGINCMDVVWTRPLRGYGVAWSTLNWKPSRP